VSPAERALFDAETLHHAAIIAEQETTDRRVVLETEWHCDMCRITRVTRQHQVCRSCDSDFNDMIREQRRGY
jgi:hypothetical protein